MTPGDFISSFYEGLLDSAKTILDTSSVGGIFIDMGPEYGEQLIERITSNTAYWYNERSDPPKKEKSAGMFEVDDKMAMQAQLDSIQHMLKQMMQAPTQNPSSQVPQPNVEQVDLVGYSRPQGQGQGYGNYQQQGRNQFVPSWNNQGNQVRNPPPGFQGNQGNKGGNQGSQWRNNQNQNQGQFHQGNQGYGNSQGQGFSKPSQDVDMRTFMNTMMAQMGKLQVNAVTTRSGLSLKDPPFPSDDPVLGRVDEETVAAREEVEVEGDDIPDKNKEEPAGSAKRKAPVQEERLWRSRETERENKFKMMLDKLEISMPFVDVVTQIPSYKKFLKDILSNKKKLEKSAVVDLSEGALTCAVLQQKLPPKLKDLGSFTIPCIIGGFVVGSALCDLGASVSLMPYSLCKRLNLGNPKPTTMTL
ncbi:uncharacterized protein LOC116024099 [Ipomoea triloba]|uniref:uncharacterized protein LOC116024099 n=1 Tax=Ipomoea triloba TaxID=35885 RepID=UPI00125E0C18|nr:uncharacterized protein LOC116024099 [Ipomoea triloba]